MTRPASVAFDELQPSGVADPARRAEGEKRVGWAKIAGYPPVSAHVNRAITEHGLRTMSTVDRD